MFVRNFDDSTFEDSEKIVEVDALVILAPVHAVCLDVSIVCELLTSLKSLLINFHGDIVHDCVSLNER